MPIERTENDRPILASILRGLGRRCPKCGVGAVYAGYLKQNPRCPHCEEPIGEIRTDDIAPYFTILVVGHLIVPIVLMVEQAYEPSTAVHMALWPTLTLALTLLILPRIKAGIVGLMWALKMRGDEQH